MLLHLFFLISLLTSLAVQAQVDPSSELLLSSEKHKSDAIETGRYQIRAPAQADTMKIRLKKEKPGKLPGKKVKGRESMIDSMIEQSTSVVYSPSPVTTSTVTTTTTMKSVTTTTSTTTTTTTLPLIVEQPNLIEQVKSIVSDDEQPIIEAYKEQIHPDDVRLNQIEIAIKSGALSNTANSNYSFRNYSTFSPHMGIGGKLWLTPFLGLYGQYITSLGADISSDAGTGNHVSVQHEITEIGFDLRKFYGMSRKANSLQYGLFFSDYKMSVPGDDAHRVHLRSSGLGIKLSARVPVAPTYSWIFGGKLIPRVQHHERATGISLSSGSPGESTRVDLSLGGEFKMSRQSQIIWDLTISHEKNQFSGEASHTDPETGQKPKGVSVNNTLTIFSLGYRWGQ